MEILKEETTKEVVKKEGRNNSREYNSILETKRKVRKGAGFRDNKV